MPNTDTTCPFCSTEVPANFNVCRGCGAEYHTRPGIFGSAVGMGVIAWLCFGFDWPLAGVIFGLIGFFALMSGFTPQWFRRSSTR